MKNKLFLYIASILFILFSVSVIAQPNWSVNHNDFIYSMTMTGVIETETVVSSDTNDIVGAFVNGQCRGVAPLSYLDAVDDYFSFLIVYSNNSVDTIDFKIYDASTDSIIDADGFAIFESNGIIGSIGSPYLWTDELNEETDFISFSFPEQIGQSLIDTLNHTIEIELVKLTDLSALTPTFEVSSGALVYVETTEQQSGITVNDYSDTLIYQIVAEDRMISQEWTVIVSVSLITDDIINEFGEQRDFNIYPNPSNGLFVIESDKLLDYSVIIIRNAIGEVVFQNNHLNSVSNIDLSNNKKGIYFIEIKSGKKSSYKTIIIN